jgi:hypothetical protein
MDKERNLSPGRRRINKTDTKRSLSPSSINPNDYLQHRQER